MAEEKTQVFRKETLERIASPEQLTDYLRVTNPGIWAVLLSVIVLLGGLLAWASVGTLETTAQVKVVVEDHEAQVISLESTLLRQGMPLRVSGVETRVANAQADEYGRYVGTSEVNLPNGTYDGTVVTETVHPISFLLESR